METLDLGFPRIRTPNFPDQNDPELSTSFPLNHEREKAEQGAEANGTIYPVSDVQTSHFFLTGTFAVRARRP